MSWPEAIATAAGAISAGAVGVAFFMFAGGKWEK